jgi:hypothetical protein
MSAPLSNTAGAINNLFAFYKSFGKRIPGRVFIPHPGWNEPTGRQSLGF